MLPLGQSGPEGRAMNQTERALQALREMIFTSQLAPESTHLESDLAERLGMSRTPVREAGLRLEAAGLVTVRPRHGLTIRGLTVQDMDDIYEVLTALEAKAAERAARNRPDAAALAPMRRAIDDMDASLARERLSDWARADEAFHRALVTLGGNQRIIEIFDTFVDQVRRARRATLRLRPMPSASNRDHRAVLEAIAKGAPETAKQAHAAHLTTSREMLTRLMRTHGITHI